MNRHTFRALLQKCLLLCIFFAGDICPSSSLSSSDFRQDGQTNPVDATFTNELVKKAYTEFLDIEYALNQIYQQVQALINQTKDTIKKSNVENDIKMLKSNNAQNWIKQKQTVLALNASLQQHQNIYKQAQIITEIIETLITTSQIARKTADDIYNLMVFFLNEEKLSAIHSAILNEINNRQKRLNYILNTAEKNLITAQAEQLIQDAYFSPEMQSIVLSCVHRPFKVNVVTGKVQNLPTTDEIIKAHQTKDIRSKINALHAAQEALELAQLTAKLDVLIQNPKLQIYNPRLNSSFMPSLDPDLQQAFTKIQNNLTKALQTVISKRSWTDYAWEWIPTPLQDAVFAKNVQSRSFDASQSISLDDLDYDNINAPKNIKTIPDALLYDIIKNFDYKQRMYADEIADLLFKQMFLAQQQVSNSFNLHAYYDDDPSNTIDQTNYVYNHVISFDQMIQKIESSSRNIKKNSRSDLLNIRKAVQTAMYIANKNSNYYVGMIIPAQFTWLIDGALSQLMAYDNQLDLLCKESEYGGLRNDQSWSLTAKIIAGVAVIGTAVAVGYGVKNSAQAIGSYVLPQPAAAPTKNTAVLPQPSEAPTKNPANSRPLATSVKDEDAKNPHTDKNPDRETDQIDMPHILNSIDPQEALATAGLIGTAGTGAYTINSKIKTAQAQAAAAKKESEILLKKLYEAQKAQAAATTPSAQPSATSSTSGNATTPPAQSSATSSASGNATTPSAQPFGKKGIPSQATKNTLQKLARTGAKGAVAAGLVGAAGYYLVDNFIPQGTYENDDQNQ